MIFVICLLMMVPAATAQIEVTDALGGDLLINTFTDEEQTYPAVAMSTNGDTLFVWQSESQDGDNAGVFGRFYNGGGTTGSAEYRVNQVTAGRQEGAAATLAWLSSDGMALWSERFSDRGYAVYGRVMAGGPLFSEFTVSTNNSERNAKGWSAISSNHHGGRLLAVWSSYGLIEEHTGIYGQYLAVGGEPIGDEFHINTNVEGWKMRTDVAMAPNGSAVVTWVSTGARGVDGIYAQRFAADMTPAGEEMPISLFPGYVFPDNPFLRSAVAMDKVGNFVVVWTLPADVNATSDDIYARRYFADGTPIGPEFRVNTYLPGRQSNADVGVDSRGN
ncbi:MAG: hypothetical protein KDE31_36020, partial [Caldilineaceae bacterium]|nr:hypothetical protein [Caldilineaceae bacterium]